MLKLKKGEADFQPYHQKILFEINLTHTFKNSRIAREKSFR